MDALEPVQQIGILSWANVDRNAGRNPPLLPDCGYQGTMVVSIFVETPHYDPDFRLLQFLG